MTWRLSNTAEADLDHIYDTGSETFGIDVAERYVRGFFTVFELISNTPHMGRVRVGRCLTARVLPHGSHVILYQIEEDGTVTILRLPHQREDWIRLFS